MKTVFFAFLLLGASAAYAQSAPVLSNQPFVLQMPEHIEHAAQHDMAESQNLLQSGAYTIEKGERPVWEFGPVSDPPKPLGDIARAYRKEHEFARKAEIVFEKE